LPVDIDDSDRGVSNPEDMALLSVKISSMVLTKLSVQRSGVRFGDVEADLLAQTSPISVGRCKPQLGTSKIAMKTQKERGSRENT